ncbi:hypothetical protein AVEN_258599-1 [Araneus ventricosus]|uniref:Uncharacterized protein n=1 Tax=Araneus ventricosus TaxID=182803 RepID=A0A4Y2JP33_ARAVE|nr:hypothetical protein AVEN_258599-1 [Araneus ventricosus]
MCKAKYPVEKLYSITRHKDPGEDLRRKTLIDNLHKKLERKMRKKQRKMAKNFEVISAVPDEHIDTEDSLGLDDFFTKLRSYKIVQN